jgi:hypothetical protein
MFVYLCLAWTVGPSVVPLYVCLGLGRPLPFGECPCLIEQPSLVLTNAGLWPRLLLAKFWRPYPISSWTSWFSPTNDLGNANLSLFDLEIFCLQIMWLPYQLNLWLAYRFLPWSLLNPSPTFPCLGMSISLDLMLLPNMTGSYVNLSSVNHLGRRKACVEFKQESLAQLSSAIKLCYLVLCFNLWIASLILNLVTTFACYSSLVWCFSLQPNLCHLKFHLFVCLIMVLRLAFYGAMTKPRASCGRAHKVVLLGTRWYQSC